MKILVVGAGIAGSAAAYMLTRDGHDVLVVDAVEQPYAGGYQILLDGAALTVLDQIGAGNLVRDLSAPAARVSVSRGQRLLTTLETPGYRSARRGDLVGAISRHVAQSVAMQFGSELVGIEQTDPGVRARFADGTSESYDLVIGADGLNSTVRRLMLETDRSWVYENGRVCLWVDVPGRVSGTDHAAILFHRGVTAQVFPYTDHDETLVLTTLNVGPGWHESSQLLPSAAQLLRSSGPEYAQFARDVLAADPNRVRITRFAQVRAPRWHARNTVLIGDAAHCIDPLSGAGAHGGLLGAAFLAQELRRTPHEVSAAAERYTRRTRPFARSAQHLTAGLLERATATSLRERFRADRSLVAAALTARPTRVPEHTYTQHPSLPENARQRPARAPSGHSQNGTQP
jgi:2-polyprenyl-6-methoxyphenol hydroxylase-like FAD-dependent oxidoreductase